MGQGYLTVEVFVGDHMLPVGGATVLVKDTNGNLLRRLTTDENGHTETFPIDTPDKNIEPYFAVYDVEVPAYMGYKRVIVHDTQVFDTITSTLPIQMHPAIEGETPQENTDEINIPHAHGVDYDRDEPLGFDADEMPPTVSPSTPPSIPSTPPSPPLANPGPGVPGNNPGSNPSHVGNPSTDFSDPSSVSSVPLANEVAIPEYITVHLGSPNAVARNVRVPFKDYVKNVASSEIFPTWEPAAIQANIYAQISFALNRVYTVIRCREGYGE